MEKFASGTTSILYRLDKDRVLKQAKPHMWGYVRKEIAAYRILNNAQHFPKLLGIDEKKQYLILSDCGVEISPHNRPSNWKQQIEEIAATLQRLDLNHNDVRKSNITVKDGVIYLVDMGHWRHNWNNKDKAPLMIIVGREGGDV
jgi:tRNA A-37 threonylcarbamoyl transferase component Bud32